jgi:hypothetical protein
MLDISWDASLVQQIFATIDKSFTKQVGFGTSYTDNKVTADQVDKVVAWGLRKSVEQL